MQEQGATSADFGLRISDCGLKKARTAHPQSAIRNPQFRAVLDRIYAAAVPALTDIETVLRTEAPEDLGVLFGFAEAVRRQFVGDGVLLRGIVEFSNICRNTCRYWV